MQTELENKKHPWNETLALIGDTEALSRFVPENQPPLLATNSISRTMRNSILAACRDVAFQRDHFENIESYNVLMEIKCSYTLSIPSTKLYTFIFSS